MKITTTVLFSTFIFLLFGQQQLKDVDTAFDYQERFYRNGELKTINLWGYFDQHGISIAEVDIPNNPHIDTSNMERVQIYLWIEYFDKKWIPCDSAEHSYYCLREYDDYGYIVGKSYYFRKNGEILYVMLRYPELNDSVFEGVRKIRYDKGKVTWVDYELFLEDSLRGYYYNSTWYYPNGQLKLYGLSDDSLKQYETKKYSKAGYCTYELKHYPNEGHSYTIKRKRKGRKEVIDQKVNGVRTKTVKVNGKEVRQRTLK